ncbi:hypothetical protein L596_019754 [Steinernema carpocapsae]|nr:hypothetical protein L596_019754 [Steinernema carpocapsae]
MNTTDMATAISSGCYALNCILEEPLHNLIPKYIQLLFSSLIIVAGSVLQYLIYRFNTKVESNVQQKINHFTRYVFYLRIVLEVLPYSVDVFLLIQFQKRLGIYIGNYIAVGGSVDMLICTLVYFSITKKSKIVPNR